VPTRGIKASRVYREAFFFLEKGFNYHHVEDLLAAEPKDNIYTCIAFLVNSIRRNLSGEDRHAGTDRDAGGENIYPCLVIQLILTLNRGEKNECL